MSTPEGQSPTSAPTGGEFLAAAASPEFAALRRTLYCFVLPMTVFFLLWYTT